MLVIKEDCSTFNPTLEYPSTTSNNENSCMKLFSLLIFLTVFQVSFSQNDSIIDYGQQLIDENKLNEAIEYFNNYLSKPSTDHEQKALMLMGLGSIYKLKLEFDESYKYYNEARKEIDRTDNVQLKFLFHVKMMEFYRKRRLFTEAIDHETKAEKLLANNRINDTYLSSYYNRKAAIFTEHYNDRDSTLKYANKSLELAKKVENNDNIVYSSLEIAAVYHSKKDYNKEIAYLEELLEFSKKHNLIQHQADIYINYSNALIKDNQLEKALNVSLTALDFTKKNNLLFNEIIISINVYETYKKLGNTEKAYEYLLYRLVLTEEYNIKEHDKNLFELEEKYKLNEKEKELQINTLEIKNKKEALAASDTKLLITVILFLVVAVSSILLFILLRKSRNKNYRLKALSQENEFLLSEANHRINNNLQLVVILISDRLKKTIHDGSFEIKNILTKVEAISTLHKHLYKNEDKKKVDISKYLDDVKKSFFDVFNDNNIKVDFEVSCLEIPTDYAMYYGLLLTELCINSIKHAFDYQEDKVISFELICHKDIIQYRYSDNGTAIFNKMSSPKLVSQLCRQLKVDYQIDTSEGFNFSFEQKISID